MQSQNISLPSKAGSVAEIQNALRPFDMVQAKVTQKGFFSESADGKGYIDVDDGGWRRNVLVTTLRCFSMLATDLIHGKSPTKRKKTTYWFYRQHIKSITIIKSPT